MQERKSEAVLAWRRELANPEALWAWRSSVVAAGVPWGVFLPQLHLVTDSHEQGHLR